MTTVAIGQLISQIIGVSSGLGFLLWEIWRRRPEGPSVRDLAESFGGQDSAVQAAITNQLIALIPNTIFSDEARQILADAGATAEVIEAQLRDEIEELRRLQTPTVIEPFPRSVGGPTEAELAAQIGPAAASMAIPLSQASLGSVGGLLSRFARTQHQERLGCYNTTGQLLVNLLQTTLPSVFASEILLDADHAGGFVGRALEDFVTALTGGEPIVGAQVQTGEAPQAEAARELASQQVVRRIVFGLRAHAMATLAEQYQPAKTMGLHTVSALMADMAGFQRLASALMDPYETAAIRAPLTKDAAKKYRPAVPNLNDILLFYAKKELQPSEMAEFMAQNGFSQFWVDVVEQAGFLDPRLGEIVRIGQFFQPSLTPELENPTPNVIRWWDGRPEWVRQFAELGVPREAILGPDWWFYYKFAKSGYEPTDVKVLTQVAKRATARREQTMFLATASLLYEEGLVDDAGLQALIDEAWELSNPKDARRRAVELRRELEEKQDLREIVLGLLARGGLTPQGAMEKLQVLGMSDTRAEIEVTRERLALIPRARVGARETEEPLLLEEALIQ